MLFGINVISIYANAQKVRTHENWVEVQCTQAGSDLLKTIEDIHEEVYAQVKNLVLLDKSDRV